MYTAKEPLCDSRGASWAPVPNRPTVSVDLRQQQQQHFHKKMYRAQELCKNRGRPGLPVPIKPNRFCGRKTPWKKKFFSSSQDMHGVVAVSH